MKGRQWLALDAYFFGKPFPIELQERFGPTGVILFIGFLCACKRSHPQGQISYMSDTEALHQMGLDDWQLVDGDGEKWTLNEFWTFTGRKKQTKKTARGHVLNVKSTHWERWQDVVRRDMAAERQRRSRATNGRDMSRDKPRDDERDAMRTDIDLDLDSDIDIPPTPLKGVGRRFAQNGKTRPPDPPRPPIVDWQPEPEPAAPVDQTALAALRAEHGWTKPETP